MSTSVFGWCASPLVAGFAKWRTDVRVAGVIVNRVASTRHERMLAAALDQLVDCPVLGMLPRGIDGTPSVLVAGVPVPANAIAIAAAVADVSP